MSHIDLRDVDEEEINGLRTMLRENHLLVFRGQGLATEEQIRVCGWFGPVSQGLNGEEHAYISNVHERGLAGANELVFHSDYSFTPAPLYGIALYGDEVEGGAPPTRFVSGARRLAALSPELNGRARSLLAMHFVDWRPGHANGTPASIYDLGDDASRADFPRTVHPVVLVDPWSGAEVLFVNQRTTSHIIGVSQADSDALLDQIFSALYDEEHVYTHNWEQGDFVLWNNIAVQHGRPRVAGSAKRTLRRVVLSPYSESYAVLAATT